MGFSKSTKRLGICEHFGESGTGESSTEESGIGESGTEESVFKESDCLTDKLGRRRQFPKSSTNIVKIEKPKIRVFHLVIFVKTALFDFAGFLSGFSFVFLLIPFGSFLVSLRPFGDSADWLAD